MAEYSEKRQSVRVPVQLEAVLRQGSDFFRGTVLNCSTSGMFIRTDRSLNPGDVLEIKIQLPGALAPIRTTSRVIWTDYQQEPSSSGIGVHFLSLSETDAELLRNFLYSSL